MDAKDLKDFLIALSMSEYQGNFEKEQVELDDLLESNAAERERLLQAMEKRQEFSFQLGPRGRLLRALELRAGEEQRLVEQRLEQQRLEQQRLEQQRLERQRLERQRLEASASTPRGQPTSEELSIARAHTSRACLGACGFGSVCACLCFLT